MYLLSRTTFGLFGQVPCEADITGYSAMIPVRIVYVSHSKGIKLCETQI